MPSRSRRLRWRRPGFVSAAIDGETGSAFRLAGRLVSSRHSADPALAATSIPIARLHADRTVALLPDAAPTEPDLILIDVAEPVTGTAADRRRRGRPARASSRGLDRVRPGPDVDAGTAARRFAAILIGLAAARRSSSSSSPASARWTRSRTRSRC